MFLSTDPINPPILDNYNEVATDYEETITLAQPTSDNPMDIYIRNFDLEENRIKQVAQESGWPELNWLRQNLTEAALITRLETPFYDLQIKEIIKDYQASKYFEAFLRRRDIRHEPGQNHVHVEALRQMDEVPSGYYSAVHASVGPLAMEAGHTLALVTRMQEQQTSERYYVQLLLEVIVPEILIEFLQEDLHLDREDAIKVLENKDAISYGALIFDSKENRDRLARYRASSEGEGNQKRKDNPQISRKRKRLN